MSAKRNILKSLTNQPIRATSQPYMRLLLHLLAFAAISFATATATATASASATASATALQADEVSKIEHLDKWDNLVFEIEDTKCRVGIASVRLIVSTLRPENGYLIGEYTIEVPLMTSKNDKGLIKLPLHDQTVSRIGQKGGTLRGQAISYKKGKTPSTIVCEILPLKNKTIFLAITTSERTLEFKSNYTVLNSRPFDG